MTRRTWGVLVLLLAPMAWAQDPPLVSADPLPPEAPVADARVQSTMLGAQWEIERCYFGRGKKTGDDREAIKRQEDLKEARAAMQRRKG